MDIKRELFEKAKQAGENAYAPYSGCKVGAALCTPEGEIYASCNVENISFPCGTCAEAGAIAAMASAGGRRIKALLVVAGGEDLVYPCGACLQRIAEFAEPETAIYLASPGGIRRECRLKELLPCAFKSSEVRHG